MATNYLADTDEDWMSKLNKYAADKTAGQTEYARAQSVYNYKNSINDTAGAEAAKKWMGQVDTAMGGAASSSSSKMDNIMSQYNTYLANKLQRKDPDPTTDATYQSALAAAKAKVQQGAKTATNNAMVSLGSRGIGNSSVAVDRANQIQQAANEQLQTQIEPQLLQDYYTRYMQEQTLKQQDLSDIYNAATLQNTLDQTAFSNNLATQQQALQNKQANLSAATTVGNQLGRVLNPKDDWSQLYNQTDAPLNMDAQNAETQKNQWDKTFNADQSYKNAQLALSAEDNARQNMYTNAQIANMNADNARQDAAASTTKTTSAQNANTYISNLNKRFITEDPDTKAQYVTDKDGLERAILALKLPYEQTSYLYNYYGLEIPN